WTSESSAKVDQGPGGADPAADELFTACSSPGKAQDGRAREVNYRVDPVVLVQLRRGGDDAHLPAESIEGTGSIPCQYDDPIAACHQAADEVSADETRASTDQHRTRARTWHCTGKDRVTHPFRRAAQAQDRERISDRPRYDTRGKQGELPGVEAVGYAYDP